MSKTFSITEITSVGFAEETLMEDGRGVFFDSERKLLVTVDLSDDIDYDLYGGFEVFKERYHFVGILSEE